MSLVNQMLQDLDRRDAQDAPSYVMHNDGSTEGREYRWAGVIRRLLWVFCTLLACATLFVVWQQASRSPDNFYFVEPAGVLQGPNGSPASTALDNFETHSVALHMGAEQLAERTTDLLISATIDFGSPELEPTLIEPARANTHAFAPSYGLQGPRQFADPEAAEIAVMPATGGQTKAAAETKTTRLSKTTIKSADSGLHTNTTPLKTFSKSSIGDTGAGSSISIQPAGGAAARSYKQARLYLDEWKTNEAKTELERTLLFDPGHISARELLAAMLLQQGDEFGAESLVDVGIINSPEHSPFVQLKARILSSRGDVQGAIVTMESVAPDRTHQNDHNTTLAALYQKSGDHAKAVSGYLALIESDPEEPALWSGLAISLDALGQYKAALKSYKQALRGPMLSPELRRYAHQRVKAINGTIGSDKS
jgi:predicted Zn-dependent protease